MGKEDREQNENLAEREKPEPFGTPITQERVRQVTALPVLGAGPAQKSVSGLPSAGSNLFEAPHPYMRGSAEPLPAGIAARAGSGHADIAVTDKAASAEAIRGVLRQIYDPEIPVNLYDLGLIYDVDVREDGFALIRMTLTAPACPVAGALVQEVADKTAALPEISQCEVELVWDPPWTQERMSEEARLELGLF